MNAMVQKYYTIIKPYLWAIGLILGPPFILLFDSVRCYINHQHIMKSWVETTGKIIEYESRWVRSGTVYRIRVEYDVGLNKLQSPSVKLGFKFWQKTVTRESFPRAAYSPWKGHHLTIYYNPKNPTEVSIDPKTQNEVAIIGWSMIAITIGVIMFFIYFIFFAKDPEPKGAERF